MRFISSNRRTILSVTSAFVFAVALAGCSTAPTSTPLANGNEVNKAEMAKKTLEPTDKNMKSITWLTSYDKALTKAKAENKPIMIDFYADWCVACKQLDKNIYASPDVIKKSKDFINLKVNIDKEQDIAARYKAYFLPTLIFLDGNGKVLWRLEGVATTSYFIDSLQKVQNKFISEA